MMVSRVKREFLFEEANKGQSSKGMWMQDSSIYTKRKVSIQIANDAKKNQREK
jgi:hypothetical protein